MKNKIWILVIICALVGAGVLFYISTRNSENKPAEQYEASRSSTNVTNEINTQTNTTTENVAQENDTNVESQHTEEKPEQKAPEPPIVKEEQIASFSTKIYSNDSARQNNLSITSSTLNGTIVRNGETFSFCNTVGQSSTSKGYQKADIFDNNGNKKKGLGGGNCQISTTLYNAVLAVPSLVVTERHEHSNYVPYIKDGKDAAVAYGSYDLKFRNNSGNDIKILCQANAKNVTVTLVSLK